MSWASDSMGNVCPAKPIKSVSVSSNDDVWQLNLDQIESHSGNILSKLRVPYCEAGNSTHWFDNRHVLYSKLRPYLNKVVLPDEQGLATTELLPLLPDKERLNRKYLAYYLRSNQFVNWVKSQVAGAKMPRVSMKVFWDHQIPLPPLPEQKRIAAILDKADAIRRKRQQAIQLSDQLLRAVFLEMFGDPVTNLKGWEVKCVGELADCIVPGRDKPKSFTGEIPWVTTNDLRHLGKTKCSEKFIGLTDAEVLQVRAKIIPRNSVLMTCVGDLGVLSIADNPMIINQQLHAFLPSENFESVFLMFALSYQKHYMLKMASNTTLPYMNKTICNSVPVIAPPKKVQKEFSQMYEKHSKNCIKSTQNISQMNDLFSSLSQKAFAGKL